MVEHCACVDLMEGSSACWCDPPRDDGGAGEPGLGECGLDLFKLGWVEAVGEAGQVAKAVGGLDDWGRVAVYPYSCVGGEGSVGAQQVQLPGVTEVEADQAAGAGPLVPGCAPLGLGV